jgi:hypothetical protein
MSGPDRAVLPVDDPTRPSIRRAVFGTLWSVALFVVFTATKELKPIYLHAPWLNDPYDTVISFAMFFVPLMAAFVLVQVSLCLRSEPLFVSRVVSIVRACRVAIGVITVELLSAWLAVILRANEGQWTPEATGLEVGLLFVVTLFACVAAAYLARVPHVSRHDARADSVDDWIGDAVVVAKRESRRLGVFRSCAMFSIELCEGTLIPGVRRHLITAAAMLSAGFGMVVFGWQALREGYVAAATLLSMGLGFCGMFSFLVLAGSYFRLVRSTNPSFGFRRRAIDGSVVACGAAVVVLAFRDNLWELIGSTRSAAGPARLAALEGGAILLGFTLTILVESLLRSHDRLTR